MKDYDNEDNMPNFSHKEEDNEMADEPNEEQQDSKHPDFIDDNEDDEQDLLIHKKDALIVTATAQNDFSNLEIYLFEEENSNLYIHHEIMLATFPLCMEWIPYNPKNTAKPANFLAVGTFMPFIEIWNLDVLDAIQPDLILGGDKSGSWQPGSKPINGGHTDAVMGLSINKHLQNVFASGSADKTVKIWDLSTEKAVHTFKKHSDKVQVVHWNPNDQNALLSAGFDKKAFISNAKDPNSFLSTDLRANLEKGKWHPTDQHLLMFTYEDGVVQTFDTRKFESPILEFQAHEKACTSISICPTKENLVATGSADQTVKIWDFNMSPPELIHEKEMRAGDLFSCEFYDDSPFILACGGSTGELAVWDIMENKHIARHFLGKEEVEKLIEEEKDVDMEMIEENQENEDMEDDDDSSEEEDGIIKPDKSVEPVTSSKKEETEEKAPESKSKKSKKKKKSHK